MNFSPWRYNENGWLEFNRWAGVEVLFSVRSEGGAIHELPILNYLGSNFVKLHQIHSAQVFVVNEPGDRGDGDGLLTSLSGLWLTVSVADCLPIYIYERSKKVIGLLHAGSKGTRSFILKNALSILFEQFNSTPKDISLLFGPSICAGCYGYDLWGENERQAKEMGVVDIINPKICNAEFLDMFYSYRKERGTTGRMLAAIRRTR